MKKIIIAISVLALILSNSVSALAFSDVRDTTPYSNAIKYLEVNDIVNGDKFEPNKSLTRGSFAEWMLRNAGFTDKSYTPVTPVRFSDVPLNKTQLSVNVYKLIDLGVIKFTDFSNSKFEPKKLISRAEALTWMFTLEGVAIPKIIDESSFKATDVNVHSALAPLAQKAIDLGIFKPGVLGLDKKLTRGLAAQYLEKVKLASSVVTIQIADSQSADLENREEFDTFLATYNRINSSYLRKDQVNKGNLLYGAIEGMVKELGDKHTIFERPGDNAVVDSLSNQVEGIGAILEEKEGAIVVVTPIVNSPAEKAGLLPNDIIRKVDGVEIKGQSLTQIVSRIKGKKGTVVELTIERGGQTLVLKITRDIVMVKSVSYERTAENIFVIRVTSFGQTTGAEFTAALNEMAKQEPAGIIIDLRFNGGGYLNVVQDMLGHFVPLNKTVTTVKYTTHEENLLSAGKGELKGKKVIVLVNSGSASASEIMAGALQDYHIATIMGDVSYGKGTVQELDGFTDGSTLKLTIAEWLTPNKNHIDGKGIIPDILVKNLIPAKGTNAVQQDDQMIRAKQEILK